MEGKVFYVWFDAPIEYIAATAEWADAHGLGEAALASAGGARTRARPTSATSQFMGKDNVPFHTLSLPRHASSGIRAEPWKLVDYIKSFNYLNYEGGKFSTSPGPRRLHGPGARDPARRLLALVADGERRPRGRTRTSPGRASRPA